MIILDPENLLPRFETIDAKAIAGIDLADFFGASIGFFAAADGAVDCADFAPVVACLRGEGQSGEEGEEGEEGWEMHSQKSRADC